MEIDDEELRRLVERGHSVRATAQALGVTVHAVRRRMSDLGLETSRMAAWRENACGSQEIVRRCDVHGEITYRRDGRGTPRCPRCVADRVTARRRRIKELLVAEAGGRCVRCGYDRCLRALAFHHLDPSTKRFGVAARGHSRSLARAREEAAKCALLCANCHAEVEAGIGPVAYYGTAIGGSSMAEQHPVKVTVVGSSPTPRAS